MINTRQKIAPNGPEFSRLVYGMWRLAEDPLGTSPERVREKIDTCLDVGITTFDHADIYGLYTCEGLFGKTLRADPSLRDRIEIVTKSGINVPCPGRPNAKVNHYDASAAAMVECLERSLTELGTDRVDLLLVHRPDWLTPADETAKALNQLIRDGKVLAAGVSNYNIHQFELLNSRLEQPLVTNQIELSLLRMDPIEDGTLNQCERLRISPMAWSPTGGGRLFNSDDATLDPLRAKLAELSGKYDGATPDQLAYAWILALPASPLCILGTNQLTRIRSASKATAIALDRQDWYAIWEAARGQALP